MKRMMIYWKNLDTERAKEAKETLGITGVSVNRESEYKGDPRKLEQYINEGTIVLRVKEYEERRIKEVRVDSVQGKPYNCQAIGRSGRKRKV